MLTKRSLPQLFILLLVVACVAAGILPQRASAQQTSDAQQTSTDQQTADDAQQDDAQQQESLTWENLEAKADELFQETGLDGALLVTRNGEIVLNKG